MAFFDFPWIDSVVAELAERDLATDDIEAIIAAPGGQATSRSTDLPVAFGHSADGRFVIVAYRWVDQATVQPIAAHEVPEWPSWFFGGFRGTRRSSRP